MRRALSYALSAALAATLLVPGVASAGQLKVNLCHLSWTGTFHLISVPDAAARNHVAHGDAAPGEAVPGSPGYIFGPACELVPSGVVLVRVTSTDAAGVVHLVAQVEDTDGNGTYGAGDTLRTGEFPYFAGDGTIAYAPAAVTEFVLGWSQVTLLGSGSYAWAGGPEVPFVEFARIFDMPGTKHYQETYVNVGVSVVYDYVPGEPHHVSQLMSASPSQPSYPGGGARLDTTGDLNMLTIEWFVLP